MKKKLIVILAVSALYATMAFAGRNPGSGISGSLHDLNYVSVSYNTAYQQDDFQRVCIFCHTPHNAIQASGTLDPLWNHAMAPAMPTAPYQWAAPANLAAANAGSNAMAFNLADYLYGPSRLCMSCHDGVTAVDAHGAAGSSGASATGVTNMVTSAGTTTYTDGLGATAYRYFNAGASTLATTHPIGFKYQDAYVNRGSQELVDVNGTAAKFFDTVAPQNVYGSYITGTTVANSKLIKDTLYDGYVTCASCHEVHNKNNADNAVGVLSGAKPNYFVWAREEGSALCLSCHKK
jgi:hypothetical protein